MNARIFALLLLLFLAVPLSARDKSDVITMKNGDRLTCEIKGLSANTLYISVSYILGTLSVDWSKVDYVESRQQFIVKTRDGLVYSGTLSTAKTSGGRPSEIQILNPADKRVDLDKTQISQMDQTSSNLSERFNGDIGWGVIYSKGNQSTQYSLSSAVNYPRENWAVGASYNSTLATSTRATPSTRNQVDLGLQRLLRWNNWYSMGLADFLQSSEQGIRLQTTLGGGVGRYLKNGDHAVISVIGGMAWQRIDYQQKALPSPTQDVASGLIGSDVKLFYFNKTTFSLSANLFPAVSEPGRVHFNLNTAYSVKLWSNLNWNISLYGNWDNRPPPGFAGSDYGTSSGLSWTFGNH
jgi:Protein of unknown function, DUF481